MKKTLLAGVTALLMATSAAHATEYQGKLPTPVQRLPKYPPVVCVAPNWATEPCENRQPKPELSESEPKEYPKGLPDNAPGWFKRAEWLPKPWNIKVILEKIKECEEKPTMFCWLDSIPLWPSWMWHLDLKEVRVLAEFATKSPLGSWPAVFHIQPLDAVEPLGDLEPVERNDWFDKHRKPLPPGVWIKGRGYVVHYDNGGLFDQYKERWSEIGMKDDQVEVLDHCASGCTMITMYIPKDRLCFGPNAYLAFHMAGTLERPNMEITKWMVSHYPKDIRIWLEAGGAPEKMTVQDVWKLPASELWKMGYRKCND
jgi:hypothetical protein